jgi:hypothetical protein
MRWLACREIGCCDRSLLPQSFENDDNVDPHVMTAFYPTSVRTLNGHRMDHDAHIQAAITDLESQGQPNIAATARRWQIARETLSKRFRGETGPNRDATSYARRQLTGVQEDILIGHINKLSNRGLLLTPQIIKNIAQEIAYVTLGKN